MRKRTCRVILNSASAPTTLDDDLPNRQGANKVKTSKKQTLSTSNKKTRSMRQSTSNIQTNKLCPATFLLMVLPKSFCAIELLRLYLTVFNRVVLTSTSLEERAAVFVFFHFLLNKLAAGQGLVIKCDHDTALKVLDEIPTSRGGFLCSLCSAMALLGRQLVGQVDSRFLFVSSWMGISSNCIRSFPWYVHRHFCFLGVTMGQRALVVDLKRSSDLVLILPFILQTVRFFYILLRVRLSLLL